MKITNKDIIDNAIQLGWCVLSLAVFLFIGGIALAVLIG